MGGGGKLFGLGSLGIEGSVVSGLREHTYHFGRFKGEDSLDRCGDVEKWLTRWAAVTAASGVLDNVEAGGTTVLRRTWRPVLPSIVERKDCIARIESYFTRY